jgi:phthiodiolone/phenolphthiodiolone dimycocerosates ketoreductase
VARDERLLVGIHGSVRPPYTLGRLTARLADRLRFDSYWLIDQFMGIVPPGMWSKELTPAARLIRDPDEFFDPFVLLGALSQRTKRLRLGVAVTDTVRLRPASIARAALTLQHTTKGRFILGIGAGERENLEPYGLPADELAARCEEALQVIRRLWGARGPVTFEGRYFHLRDAALSLRPYLKRPPPIWLAAMGPKMLETAGRLADGWIPHSLSPERYAASLERVRAAARAAGRDPASITPALVFVCLIDGSHEACHAALTSPALRLGALVLDAHAWRDAGGVHPFGEGFRGMVDFVPTNYSADQLRDAMEKISSEVMHALFPHGTPEEIADSIHEYERAGLRHVVLENVIAVAKPSRAPTSLAAMARTRRVLRRSEAR